MVAYAGEPRRGDRVCAGRCHVDATIVGLLMPRGMVGARRFEVRVGALVCGR